MTRSRVRGNKGEVSPQHPALCVAAMMPAPYVASVVGHIAVRQESDSSWYRGDRQGGKQDDTPMQPA